MRKYQAGFTITELFIVSMWLLIAVGAVGWVWNLVKIAQACCDISGMLILRVVGVFIAPIGAVIGFL